MDSKNDDASTVNHAIEETIERLAPNPPNNLPDEVYRGTVKAGWDDQWLNWDQNSGNGSPEPDWGDAR